MWAELEATFENQPFFGVILYNLKPLLIGEISQKKIVISFTSNLEKEIFYTLSYLIINSCMTYHSIKAIGCLSVCLFIP